MNLEIDIPPRWADLTLIKLSAVQRLIEQLINPSVVLPQAIHWSSLLNSSPYDIGGIQGALECLGDTITSVLRERSQHLLRNGWGPMAIPLIRIAIFIHELVLVDEEQGYVVGYEANEYGVLVAGFLEMVALALYVKRVLIPSVEMHRSRSQGTAADLFTALGELYAIELDSLIRHTVKWVHTNVGL